MASKNSKAVRVDVEVFLPEVKLLMKEKDLETTRRTTKEIGKMLRNNRINKKRMKF